jgi:DNA invertase Pin-like site-specific DNA recombinase
MDLLDELKAKEARLVEQLTPIGEQYQRLSTELAMVRHGIRTLAGGRGKRRHRGPLPDDLIKEAVKLREQGVYWQEIALGLGVSIPAVQKAVERWQKGNPHLVRNRGRVPKKDATSAQQPA